MFPLLSYFNWSVLLSVDLTIVGACLLVSSVTSVTLLFSVLVVTLYRLILSYLGVLLHSSCVRATLSVSLVHSLFKYILTFEIIDFHFIFNPFKFGSARSHSIEPELDTVSQEVYCSEALQPYHLGQMREQVTNIWKKTG